MKNPCVMLALSLFSLTILSVSILTMPSASADSSTIINVALDVPAACSLTLVNGTNNEETLSTIINPGARDTIGSSSMKAVCNDPNGLAVYAVGYSNDTYGNTNLIDISDNTNTIATNYTANNPSSSEWYMSLAAVSGTYAPTIPDGTGNTENFTSNHAIPSVYTKVAYRNSNTDVDSTGYTATGANFTATFGAYISTSQPSGTYDGKVKFLLIYPSTHTTPVTPKARPHGICYYGNGEDEGAMACQSVIDIEGSTAAISANADVQLRASNFSRSGYGFTGWNTKEDGSGTQYGPMETITFTQEMYDNGLMLFANWKAAETGVTMQTFKDTVAPYSTAPNGTVIALRDIRDNDVYAVAKLADGNWWMIENLRLDYNANITTSNTQSDDGAWGGVFAGLAEPESANFIRSSTVPNSLYTTDISSTDLRIIIGGGVSSYGNRFPRYNNYNTASRAANQTSPKVYVYSYGNYYTWPAAVADTTYYTGGSGSITSTSICPTGWHLPKGGSKSNETNSEWWPLATAVVGSTPTNYDSTTSPYYTGSTEGVNASKAMRTYPTNLVYAGTYYDSSAQNRGIIGGYWSSTVESNNDSGALLEVIYRNYVKPGANVESKSKGCSVRCLAD